MKKAKMNKKIDVDKVINIIQEWHTRLGYTKGIIVRLEKVCSNYDLTELLEEIKDPEYKLKKEKAFSKLLYG
jgi:hypothetical protein